MFSAGFKVAITEEVFRESSASFHDAILDALDISVPDDELKMVFMSLPEELQILALEWTLSDTQFGDDVVRELEKFKKPYTYQINKLIKGIRK